MLHINSVKYLQDFKLSVSFSDGTTGEVDFEGRLQGPVFEPLQERDYFARVCVDPELETPIWPNGADLAPEFVKALL